jgi:hypothetical protein
MFRASGAVSFVMRVTGERRFEQGRGVDARLERDTCHHTDNVACHTSPADHESPEFREWFGPSASSNDIADGSSCHQMDTIGPYASERSAEQQAVRLAKILKDLNDRRTLQRSSVRLVDRAGRVDRASILSFAWRTRGELRRVGDVRTDN